MRTTLIEKMIQINGGAPFFWMVVLFLCGLVVLAGRAAHWRNRWVFLGLWITQLCASAAGSYEIVNALGSWAEHIRDPGLDAYFIGAEYDILFWMLVLAVAFGCVTGGIAFMTTLRSRRDREGECPRCRYPLQDLGSDPRCPECGVKASSVPHHST